MGDCCSHYFRYLLESTTSTINRSVSSFDHQSLQQQQEQEEEEEAEERTRLLSNKHNKVENASHGRSTELLQLPDSSDSQEPIISTAVVATTPATLTTSPAPQLSNKDELEDTEISTSSTSKQHEMADNHNHETAASAPLELHHKGQEDPHFYQDEASEEGPRWNKARPETKVKNPKFDNFKAGLPKHMLKEKEKPRYKSNSTSSLYIKDTLSMPDIDELLRCISIAILYHIEAGHASATAIFVEIFSEEKHPLTKGALDLKSIPNWKRIYKFLSTIFRAERLSSECAILCLAYIERIMGLSGITLHASNWRRVVLAALILASKVWEDQAVWNVDFLSIFPCVTVQDLAQLEKTVLNLLKFNVSLKASLYAKYYFELKGLAEQDGNRSFSLEPLNREDAERLEKRSEDRELAAKKEFGGGLKVPRSNSDTTAKTKPARMVLN